MTSYPEPILYLNSVLTLDSLKEYRNNTNTNTNTNTNDRSNIVLVFDTETTGLVNSRIIQLSFILYDTEKGEIIFSSQKNKDYILLPEFYNGENINEKWLVNRMRVEDELNVMITGLESQKQHLTKDEYKRKRSGLEKSEEAKGTHIIPFGSTISHHIFDSTLYKYGRDLNRSMNEFIKYFYMSGIIAGHNITFDIKMVCIELIHLLDEKNIKITDEERMSYIQLFDELIENVDDRENAKDLNFHRERTKLIELFQQKCTKKGKPVQHIQVVESDKNKNKRIVECTMKKSTIVCRLRQAFEYKKLYSAEELTRLEGSRDQLWKLYKSPQLVEAHKIIFSQNVRGELHDSRVDVAVTLRLFMKLYKNIDICNYGSRLNKDNNTIFDIINPEDVTDVGDFPIQLFFKKMEKTKGLFYIDPYQYQIKQTKEMTFKIAENRLREIKKEFKILLPRKILEMKLNVRSNSNNEENEEIVKAFSNPFPIQEDQIREYSKTNPRRNPRRHKKVEC
jgi:DNA polymerase III epsilon subunit-like protein